VGQRGADGPLTVGPAASSNPVLAACLDAASEIGYPRAQDVSGGLEEGLGWTDLNVVTGRRQSAADAYPALAGEDDAQPAAEPPEPLPVLP
jgi:choline dehydrogenase